MASGVQPAVLGEPLSVCFSSSRFGPQVRLDRLNALFCGNRRDVLVQHDRAGFSPRVALEGFHEHLVSQIWVRSEQGIADAYRSFRDKPFAERPVADAG